MADAATRSQSPSPFLVLGTLTAALDHATQRLDAEAVARLGVDLPAVAAQLAVPEAGSASAAAHRDVPEVGTCARTTFTVADADTAAAMGHPDPSVDVLGSPRIALWFELSTSPVMPVSEDVTHVGVGVLVHHVGVARVGEQVVVATRVQGVRGRTVVFACDATVDDRLVAFGTHHRVVRHTPCPR